ncbi:MAG: hypothetical protein EU536_01340 [Promethearchaeota archaeon]|nr:MAG: hypothetical protein EU536_01340 [Candidatus Lokiarchaeota archaeon]
MPKSLCISCRTKLPPSELIGGLCFHCKKKGIESLRKFLPIIKFFGYIYKFAPVYAGFIALLYLFFNFSSTFALAILIMVVFITLVISVLGMIPHMIPYSYLLDHMRELEGKFELEFEKYTQCLSKPDASGRQCINHPNQEAVGRCTYCYEPFCAEEFIIVLGKPLYCRNCAMLIPTDINYWAAINGLLSVCIPAFVGILIIVLNFGDISLITAIGFLVFFLIPFGIFFGIFLLYSRMKCQIKAQLYPRHAPLYDPSK